MHPKAGTTKPGHPGHQNQSSQHNINRTELQKSSPNCYQQGLNEWWEIFYISIRLTLHIFSRINHYLPAFRICLLINTQTAQQTPCMTTSDFFHLLLASRSAIYLLYTIILAIFWTKKLGTRKQIEIHSMTHSFCCFVLKILWIPDFVTD